MLSTYMRNLLLAWGFTTGSATRPTTWYLSLHTADPGLTGTSEVTIGTDSDYVRKAVTFAAPSGGQAANTGAITWTANAGATTYTVTHIGVWDALTTGNYLGGGELAVPETVVAGASLPLAIGRAIQALS